MDDRPLADARRLGPRLRSAWGFAAQGLGSARQRALLALLGVTIGVASVVALVSLGKGIERQALSDFETMGTQVISVMLTDRDPGLPALNKVSVSVSVSATTSQRKPLDSEALIAALAALPEVELASEVASLPCQESAASHHSLHAVRPDLARILGLKLASGRFIHALDRHELWVVLGAQLARQLREGGHRIEPGAVLALCGRALRVAGVLAPMSVSEAVVPVPLDQALMVSARAGRRIDPQAALSQLALRVRPDVSPIEFAPRLSAHLAELTGQEVQVTTARKVLELRQRQAASTTRFLAALSSLSLLVGSLGILNVMLMAVIERRREIGLRLAIGADDLDIVLQFLFESVLLGLAGGAAGLVLGLVAAGGVTAVAGLPFVVTRLRRGTGTGHLPRRGGGLRALPCPAGGAAASGRSLARVAVVRTPAQS